MSRLAFFFVVFFFQAPVGLAAAVILQTLTLEDGLHALKFHLDGPDAQYRGSLDLLRKQNDQWILETEGQLTGIQADYFSRGSSSSKRDDQFVSDLTAVFAASQSLVKIEKVTLSKQAPTFLVSFALPSLPFSDAMNPLQLCYQRRLVHFEAGRGWAILATKGPCVEIPDLKADPKLAVKALEDAAKDAKVRVLEPRTSGWSDLEITPTPLADFPASYCKAPDPTYRFSNGFYYKSCYFATASQKNDYQGPVPCDLGAQGKGDLFLRYGRDTILAELRLPGWLQTLLLHVPAEHTHFVMAGSATVDLPVSELHAECKDGTVRLSDPVNPCAVYDLPVAQGDAWLKRLPGVLVGEETPACTAAKAEAIARAKKLEADSPCSHAKLADVKDAAVALYKQKKTRAALDLLLPKARYCRQTLLANPTLETKVYADLMLYAHRLKDDGLCWEIADEAESLNPFSKDKATVFNRALCSRNRYLESAPVKAVLKAPKAAPQGLAVCSDGKVETFDFFATENGVVSRHVNVDWVQEATVLWTGNLTSKSVRDIVTYNGACGNRGDCMYGIYIGCGGNRFAQVYDDYSKDGVQILRQARKVGGADWQGIEVSQREDKHGEGFGIVHWFDGKAYEPTPAERSRISALFSTVHERQQAEDAENPAMEATGRP